MTVRALLPACLVVLAASAPAPRALLRLGLPAAPGGATYQALLRSAVLVPYTHATGQAVQVVALPVAARGAQPDVMQLDPLSLEAGCRAGRLRRIDWDRLGGRQRFLSVAISDCGVGAYMHDTVLSWDAAKLPGTPGWADFWDVARLPGRRGLQRTPVGTLEFALLADGVAPRDVYAVLRSAGGVDRAFRKLDQLRPYIVWWRRDSEPAALLTTGAVLMTSAPNERIVAAAAAMHRRFVVQWTGALASVQSWAVSAGSVRADAALALIDAAADPARAAAIDTQMGFGATTIGSPPDATSPTTHLADALPYDAAFWRDYLAPLTARFDGWIR